MRISHLSASPQHNRHGVVPVATSLSVKVIHERERGSRARKSRRGGAFESEQRKSVLSVFCSATERDMIWEAASSSVWTDNADGFRKQVMEV